MFRRLLSVGGFTLLSRVTGFFRDVLMAAILGKGVLSDAFIIAFTFPNYFRSIFGEGAINPAFLPRYAALKAKGEHERAALFGDSVYSWQMAAQLAVLLAALAAMPWIVRLLAGGWAPDALALTTSLSRITFPYLILTVAAIQLSAMLNAIEKFWAAAAWSNFLNLTMIVALLLSPFFPNAAFAAAWGVLAGGVAQLVFMLWAARRHGLKLKVRRPRWTPEVAEFFKAFGAVTIGTSSYLIAPFIDTMIVTRWLPIGSRTALYYADRINQLPLGVLGLAIGTVLLPEMSARLAKNDAAGSDAAQNRAMALSLLLTLPFLAVFISIPAIIMRAVFAHGAFDRHAADLAAIGLMAYGIGLPAMALVRPLQSTFYARHDTATPARATLIAIVCNILIKLALVLGLGFGIGGVALGTALGAWINVGLLVVKGQAKGLLNLNRDFKRALLPIFLAGV
ncbi:MAG: murein biosynthesis integral membrane protein MurJ, partial [Alphaproteobacteria bacterium]|nr:murein biosynthesis integral membrane protein MurJ [Alphaproteobacteria bacterium]